MGNNQQLVELQTQFCESLHDFLFSIHGENAFEIRFLPEGGEIGRVKSILKKGNYLYYMGRKGIKERKKLNQK